MNNNQITQFMYGDGGQVTGDTYLELVASWDLAIAPTPPTEPDYDDAKIQIQDIVNVNDASYETLGAEVTNYNNYSSVGALTNTIVLLDADTTKNLYNLDKGYRESFVDSYDMAVLKPQQSSTNLTLANYPQLVQGDLDLLQYHSVTENYEIVRKNRYWIAELLSKSLEDSVDIVKTAYELVYGVLPINPIPIYDKYELDTSTFGATDTVVDILGAVLEDVHSTNGGWIDDTDTSRVVGGKYIIPEDGIYNIVASILADAQQSDKQVLVKVKSNGNTIVENSVELIASIDLHINNAISRPFNKDDEVEVTVRKLNGGDVNVVSGFFQITN